MTIINTPDINQARKQIQQTKKNKEQMVVKAQDEEFNQKILEHPDVEILLSPELHNRKDKLKQRDSGLNEFLCKLAKKNNKKIAIDLQSFKSLNNKEKTRVLARIIQNIELCKRTNTQLILWPENKFSKQDTLSFFLTLKSSTQLAKEAFC
jgi:RNase P/RNase MRP subunit p30